MITKVNKGRIKILLIFLTFIFAGVLVFSALKTIEYNNGLEVSEKELVEKVEKQFDSCVGNIFVKYKEFRSEEVIKEKDYSDKIKKNKEAEKERAENQIEYLKSGIIERKKDVNNNLAGLTKEQVQERIKKLDEEEQKEIKSINDKIDKTDEGYKNEIIDENLKNKSILEEQIKNNLNGIKYYIQDNKSKDFDTNSFYTTDEMERKRFSDEGYAVEVYSQSKGKTPIKRYIKSSVNIQNNYLINTQSYVNKNDVTLYIWATNSEDNWLSKLIISKDNIKSDYNKYKAMAMVSGILFIITLSLLVLRLRKTEVNYTIYNKIPQDLLIVTLIIACFIYILESGLFYIFGMLSGCDFYYLNPEILIIGAGILGTIIVTYFEFMRGKSIKEVFRKGVLLKKLKNLKYLLEIKDIVLKISMVFLVICIQIIAICIQIGSSAGGYYLIDYSWVIMPVIFIVVDGFIFYLLTKKLIYFNDILDGTKMITSGDLGLVLEEKGKGNLSKLAHNINNMKIGLKNSLEKEMKSERMKSELITNVSHDLKTPLTSIINYVDLLKKEELTPEKANDYVEILDRKSKRLKSLVEDLFEASKAASGAMELNIEKIEITELMKQTLAEVEDKILKSTLDFKVNLGKEKVYAMVDGKRTYRVFENLVQNALKYSMKHSRVYIDLILEDGVKKFIIKNMASYEMNFDVDEIAERFKRGDLSRSTEGSGLGLAIAKSIMELQGGELNIQIDGDLFKAIVIFKESN